MSKKQNLKWAYVYSEGCGPCQRITPIIDTMIAMGNKNIAKFNFKELDPQNSLRRFGTPHIVLYDMDKSEIVGAKNYGTMFWTGLFELYVNHKELLTIDISPVDFMVKLFEKTEDLDYNTITAK